MAKKRSNYAANLAADALGNDANNGYIRIYDGAQAADADTAVGAQVLLAELRFGADAFPAAVAGVLTANAITSDVSANAAGTATWFRILKSDGVTVLWDGAVGLAGSDMNLNAVVIALGALVEVTALTFTESKV